MILQCEQCGHKKNVLEQEVMQNTECDLCGGHMVFEESAKYLKEQEKKEPKIQTESEALNEVLDNQLINSMVNELQQFGEAKIWEQINHADIDTQLSIIPIFIEAKRIFLQGA